MGRSQNGLRCSQSPDPNHNGGGEGYILFEEHIGASTYFFFTPAKVQDRMYICTKHMR